jgi:phosphate transport system protein
MERHFIHELEQLAALIYRMGGMVERSIGNATRALVDRDIDLARRTVAEDEAIDQMELDVDSATMRLLALYQLAARDLRFVTTAMKITPDLERMADHAVNICERAIELAHETPLKPYVDLPLMAHRAQEMVRGALDAFVQRDANAARRVIAMDDDLDRRMETVFRELLSFMLEDPRTISRAIRLIFIAKYFERIGDQATNICEQVVYMSEGTVIKHAPPLRLVSDMEQRDAHSPQPELGNLSSAIRSGQGVALIGLDRRIRSANDRFGELAGAKGNLAHRPLAEIWRSPVVLEAVEHCLESGQAVSESFQEPGLAGRSRELQAIPIMGPDRAIDEVLLAIHDTTHIEALERMRRDFVANVSHELRTPLTSIKAAVETLADEEPDSDPATRKTLLNIAQRQVDRMEALVADLMDLSLIETGAIQLDVKPVAIHGLVEEVHQQLSAKARSRGVTLHNEVPPETQIVGDRRRIEQVFVNLIDNAIKFNRDQGTVRTQAWRDGKSTVIQVADTGQGIPGDARERVFQRFYRVDPSRTEDATGTGLGLAIVKHLMRLHGGSVELESELGQGSVFTLRFPDSE